MSDSKKRADLALQHIAIEVAKGRLSLSDLDDLNDYIAELESQVPRWIPVEERLPDLGLVVLGFFDDDCCDVVSCDAPSDDGLGHWSDKRAVICPPKYWMDIPELATSE